MDERAVDFLKKYGNASQCWMVKSLVLIYSAQQLQSYLSPLVFTGVLSRYSHRLADARNHSVYVRRYMWHVPY